MMIWVFVLLLSLSLSPTSCEKKTKEEEKRPNIVVVVVDDLGIGDIGYSSRSPLSSSQKREDLERELREGERTKRFFEEGVKIESQIPTPNIDSLSQEGVRFLKHYVHPTCTPSRASLMSGRYSSNAGLILAMLPGSVAGLPDHFDTLPRSLHQSGYRTHMVGKWHLGFSQWKQTPIGKGFESHEGSFLWDLDSFSKETFSLPWLPTCVDWTHSYANRTFSNKIDPRHATIALTSIAQKRMIDHAAEHKTENGDFTSPLFLYVAYNAAHAPLQADERHKGACEHIPHLWRKQFCGMVVGLDEAIKNLTATIKEELGENTILYFTSDNGGSTWFGGLNTPLRAGKLTPFEGGVRVPSFAHDFTQDQRYLGKPRELFDLIHISDWMPTFLDIAGVPVEQKLDGVSLAKCLKEGTECPRSSVVVDMHYGTEGESVFPNDDIASLIKGRYKLIDGSVRDQNWYYESREDNLATTDETSVTTIGESALRFIEENIFDISSFDSTRTFVTHILIKDNLVKKDLFLFDLESDPTESNNLAGKEEYQELIKEMQNELRDFKKQRPRQSKYWLGFEEDEWQETMPKGDCSLSETLVGVCRFAVPWVDDDVDLVALEETLTNKAARIRVWKRIGYDFVTNPTRFWILWVITFFVVFLSVSFCTTCFALFF